MSTFKGWNEEQQAFLSKIYEGIDLTEANNRTLQAQYNALVAHMRDKHGFGPPTFHGTRLKEGCTIEDFDSQQDLESCPVPMDAKVAILEMEALERAGLHRPETY